MKSYILLNFMLLICIIACSQKKRPVAKATDLKENIEANHAIVPEDKAVTTVDTLKYCVSNDKVGAGGYDLVNYFADNSAKVGDIKYTFNYDGLDYRFLSETNENLFKKNPTKYLPAFGGWCSMNLAMGRATKPTYDNFSIVNDTLRLFERTLSVNGKLLWQTNPIENKKQASLNYGEYVKDGMIVNN